MQVTTSQILDLLLPEIRHLKELSAVGGGIYEAMSREAVSKNLNPYTRKRLGPVAYWSGIVDVDETERTLTYDVPAHFSGTMRVMAVAVSAGTLGATSKKSLVRGHFVLSPNAPTFVAPGDEFTVSLGLSNNVEGSGPEADIRLDLKASGHLEIVDEPSRTIKIGEGKEESLTFKLRALKKLGGATLKFTAQTAGKRSAYEVGLSVRPPVPYMTTIAGGHFKSGARELPVKRKIYPDLRTLEASASTVPLSIAKGLVKFLNSYPHLCSEQVVSRAFPAAVLKGRSDIGYDEAGVESALNRAIRTLRARQNHEGAFGIWTASSRVSDYLTAYHLHFLTEAKENGLSVPQDMLDRGLSYLKNRDPRALKSIEEAREDAYAIYVLARNDIIATNQINALTKELESAYPDSWREDLTGIYLAASLKILRQDIEAERIISKSRMGELYSNESGSFYDSLLHDAQYLYIVSRHFPERLKKLDADNLLYIADHVTNRRYSTLSGAFAIIALDAYADFVGTPTEAAIGMDEIDGTGTETKLTLPNSKALFPAANFSGDAAKIRFSAESAYNLFYQTTEAGYDINLPTVEIKDGLEIQREYRDTDGNVVTKTTLGSELEVRLKVRSIGTESAKAPYLHNIAIVELLPGGFEVVLNSVRGSGSSPWRPDYVDSREDRVVLFGAVGPDVSEFVYKIKATNRGSFSVPPVYGEAMYNQGIVARSPGSKITVE